MLQDRMAVASDRRVLHGAGQGTRPLSGALILVIGCALLILLGTILLWLPFATNSGESTPFSVALFTATSAVCVTGLTVVDTGSYWSEFGQVTIMLLVEVGGIGFGSAATFLFWLLGRNISLSDRIMLRDLLPGAPVQQVARAALVLLGLAWVYRRLVLRRCSSALSATIPPIRRFTWRSSMPSAHSATLVLTCLAASGCPAPAWPPTAMTCRSSCR